MGLKKYVSHKTVMAEPMDRVTAELAGLIRDKNTVIDGIPEAGYKVVYEDGYESWSPKTVFDSGYTEMES